MLSYVLAFCRVATGLVFAWSFVGKVQDISSFIQTINRFKILPKKFHQPAAVAFLASELVVLGTMILGGKLLLWGFLLAGLLLISFSIALVSVLIRKIQIPCNCFGSSQKPISSFDVFRNITLILLSLSAYGLLIANGESLMAMLGWSDWGLIGVAAFVFVMVLVQLREISQILR